MTMRTTYDRLQNPAKAGTAAGSMLKKAPEQQTTEKKKVGRKKEFTEPRKSTNVKVTMDLWEKWEEIQIAHGSNFTGYVNKLIQKDLDENFDKYKEVADSLKNI